MRGVLHLLAGFGGTAKWVLCYNTDSGCLTRLSKRFYFFSLKKVLSKDLAYSKGV